MVKDRRLVAAAGHSRSLLLGSLAAGLMLPGIASAQTRTENFAVPPANWMIGGAPLIYGYSATDNTRQSAGVELGEAGGIIQRTNIRAHYADTSLGGTLSDADAFGATGELFFGTGGSADTEAFIGHFDASFAGQGGDQGDPGGRNVIGFYVLNGPESPDTRGSQFRYRPRVFTNAGTRLDGNTVTADYLDGSGNPIVYQFDYDWDPGLRRLTTRLLDTGGSEVSFATLDLPAGETLSLDAFGLTTGFNGSQNPAATYELFIDDVTYTVVPEPASVALLGLSGGGLLLRRRRSA